MNTGVERLDEHRARQHAARRFSRLETMVMMADLEIPTRVILQQLASAIKLWCRFRACRTERASPECQRSAGRARRKGGLQEIFTFERIGVTDSGKVQGRFRATGVTPKLLERPAH
jgi:pilus assembly protein CpaF